MDMILKALESRLQTNGMGWIKLASLNFSAKQKTLQAEVLLEGEEHPVTLQAKYRVEETSVVIEQVEVSKKWLTEAINLALLKHGGRLELPAGVKGKLIKMVL
jgi:hypothetical protein